MECRGTVSFWGTRTTGRRLSRRRPMMRSLRDGSANFEQDHALDDANMLSSSKYGVELGRQIHWVGIYTAMR